jgi:hypothetical protein
MPGGRGLKEESQSGGGCPIYPFLRSLIIYAFIAPVWFVSHAAELDGVQLPDTLQMDGNHCI